MDADGTLYGFSKTVYVADGKEYIIEQNEQNDKEILAEDSVLIIFEETGRLSGIVADVSLLNSVMFRLYLFDGEGQDTFIKQYGDEIPQRISGEASQIQRKLGTKDTRGYRNCGITVWKVNFE